MAGMDAADYHHLADQYGASPVETAHELANARWDLAHRPERVTGDDPYEVAAQALTTARARPQPQLAEVHFVHHAWGPGGITTANYGPTPADEFMRWYEKATASQR